jgi:hypothetical protein
MRLSWSRWKNFIAAADCATYTELSLLRQRLHGVEAAWGIERSTEQLVTGTATSCFT